LATIRKQLNTIFDALSIYEEAGMDRDVANICNNIGNAYYWLSITRKQLKIIKEHLKS
jgi:hypothetical protein